jgi:zinc transport system substrate-binding protein
MEEIMKPSVMLLTLALLLPVGAALAGPAAFVTVAPQKYFVDRISGGKATVSVMVEPGANPHAYEPKPKQMAALSKALVYFTIGDSFDQTWLARIVSANPKITVVHTAEGVQKIPMTSGHDHEEHAHSGEEHVHKDAGHNQDVEGLHGEAHGDKDENAQDGEMHAHGGDAHEQGHGTLDPHVWLDPALVKIQAAHIRDGLSRVDPQNAETYAANAATFMQELNALDLEIRSILSALPENQRTFLVFHPSWGYFAKAYGLNQASIEVEGKEPSPRDMARIIAMGKKTGARVVFVQPQFSEKSASVIARQIGAKVVRLDPLAADWPDNLRKAAHAFVEALK